MKNVSVIFILLFINITYLSADPFNEYYMLPNDEDGWYFYFDTNNDSYWGHASSDDRDDLRTQGFRFYGSAPYGINYHLTWSMFTNRGLDPSLANLNTFDRLRFEIPDPGRFDVIQLGGSWEFLDYALSNSCNLDLKLTGDIELVGGFGGLFSQDVFHQLIGADRPLPTENVPYRISGEVGIESTLSNVFFDGAYIGLDFQVDSHWHPLVAFQLGYWDYREKSAFMFEASYTAAGIWADSPSEQVVSQFEKGLNFTWSFYSEYFYFSRIVNLASESFIFDNSYTSVGVLGVRFGGPMNSNKPRKGNLSFEIIPQFAEHPFTIRFLYQPQWFFDVSTPWLGRLSLMIFNANGYDQKIPFALYGQWGVGFRYNFLVPEQKWSLNGYIDLGIALRQNSWTIRNLYRSYHDHHSYGIVAETSVGMTIPIWGFKNRDTAMASIGLVYTMHYTMAHFNKPNYSSEYDLHPVSHWFGVSLLLSDYNAELSY